MKNYLYIPLILSFTLTGKVNIKNGAKSCDQVVVFLEKGKKEKKSVRHQMSSENKSFNPKLLAIKIGDKVGFPNKDMIQHNVFSLSRAKKFDLGLYGNGKGEEIEFRKKGLVKVYCNIHSDMIANILIFEHSSFSRLDENCVYKIKNVDKGKNTINIWYAYGNGISKEISISKDTNLNLTLERSKKRIKPHKNKYGKNYSNFY